MHLLFLSKYLAYTFISGSFIHRVDGRAVPLYIHIYIYIYIHIYIYIYIYEYIYIYMYPIKYLLYDSILPYGSFS